MVALKPYAIARDYLLLAVSYKGKCLGMRPLDVLYVEHTILKCVPS